jgi:predicted ATPase/DNA-binding CsgD family transcriptional regulator
MPDLAGQTHGFPRALTSLVGRADEVAKVTGLLAEYRMVTVTGPGGVGKTRLASEVARQAAPGFADGAWLVELAAVEDPTLVPARVAAALGVQQSADRPVTDSLVDALTRQQVLLVLDNCEHVLAAVAELCAAVLAAADDVRLLTTSREPVNVAGETRFRLRPLPVPDPSAPWEAGVPASVALFADRARQADPDFVLTDETRPAVGQLVTRLDGMPLAIELAAARVEAVGMSQLLDRLAGSFQLLTSADRAAVAWSYQLLAEPEREVFRRLAVFPGPFTLDAAVAVAGTAAVPAVLRLVDCSLLPPPRTGPDGRSRYLMLETLRGYGAERLAEAGERPEVAAALASNALRITAEAAAGLETSTGELAAARWLDAEDANIHQGLAWSLEHDPAAALRLGVALAPWWRLRGRSAAGYALLSKAAEHADRDRDAWCAAQIWLGNLTAGVDEAVSIQHFTAARDALATRAPSRDLARALIGRASCLASFGRLAEAAGDAGDALAMARELGDGTDAAHALYWLAGVAHYQGDHQGTLAWLRQTQQIDPAGVAGRTARRCQIGLTAALIQAGENASAEQNCSQALASARAAGDLRDHADCVSQLADLDLRAGRLPEARMHLREAVQLTARTGDRLMLGDCLDYCGHLCAASQRWDEAVTIWAALAASLLESGRRDPPQDVQRRQEPMAGARHALGPARTSAATERGAAMTLSTAAEFALMCTEPGSDPPELSPGLPELSARERELVTVVAQGRTDAQIATQLFISVSTVRSHLDRIRDKTGCRRRADLTRLALQAGLA